MTVGARIKNVREQRGLSQETLAKLMGYKDRSSISKIEKETDENIYMDVIQKFADVLNCSPLYLMGWDNEEENKESYYINTETKEIAQSIFDNKELKLLFDAAKDATPEDLKTVHTMLLALKKKEGGICE